MKHALLIGIASVFALACGGESQTHAREPATDAGISPRGDARYGSFDQMRK